MLTSRSALERILRPTEGDLPAEFSRRLLAADFSQTDHDRYRELSDKAQLAQLSDDERIELDDLLTANDVLTILQAKARASLASSPSAA